MIFRVATWNIREGRRLSSDELFDAGSIVGSLDLDVLALQEVPFQADGSSPLLSSLLESTKLSFSSFLSMHESSFGEASAGLATLTNYEQSPQTNVSFESKDLSLVVDGRVQNAHNKAVTRLICYTPAAAVVVYNVHLFPFRRLGLDAASERFRMLWQGLSRQLEASQDTPTVLCGDFNTARRHLVLPADAGYTRVIGDRETHEGFASDDILVSRHFRVRDSQLLDNPSDHLLCVGEVELLSN
jgi:endonuclease/exonuclease/phosphatase family metal-dependent hydrolase